MSKRKFVEQGLKFFNQFKAYLANINVQSTENLIYTFDKRKLLSEFGTDPDRFPDATAAQNAIRQEFQGMLSDGGKADELFNAVNNTNPSSGMFNGIVLDGGQVIDINSGQELSQLAMNNPDFWKSTFFDFIKVD